MSPEPRPRSIDSDDLRIMQVANGVMITLGLRNAAEAGYEAIQGYRGDGTAGELALELALVAGVALIGVRFFWVVKNLSRHMQRYELPALERAREIVISVHFPIVIAHAFLYYVLTRSLAPLCEARAEGPQIHDLLVDAAMFLGFNILWLLVLLAKGRPYRPEIVFLTINLITVAGLGLVHWLGIPVEGPASATAWTVAAILLFNTLANVLIEAQSYVGKPKPAAA